ncbi:MAG: NAD(P)-binding domain-containing protein [Pyrinomonadaceae bacterium]|nr:NAD(P)-binding domain-containing protein [Blastocatellia bacterium]
MKFVQLLICLVFIALLIWMRQISGVEAAYGGLSWAGWLSILLALAALGLIVVVNDSSRAFGFFSTWDKQAAPQVAVRTLSDLELADLGTLKYRGPKYPHPVIFPERCIGCQACVDACPHDVLAIVDGVASAVAPDLCMEDTACQAECPVNPKACIVINTTKAVVSRPSPTRDGASYQTNVPGCYIIGDVSGVPLIKNAVKEGAEVIAHIAAELKTASAEPKADYDVAIIGIGPGGASAAATAHNLRLRYIGIEQDRTLSTIELYPKGKYIFFKPDTKDWFGGIPATGLGLSKAKYGASGAGADESIFGDELALEFEKVAREQSVPLQEELIPKIPGALRGELAPLLAEKIEKELISSIAGFLRSKGSGDWMNLYTKHFVSDRDNILSRFRAAIADQLQTKIPGDQRENILGVWLSGLAENGVKINEYESCKTIARADDGDYFVIGTERILEKSQQTYKARRVVIAIGLRGAPNKLRLPNEDLKFRINGNEESKVLYSLTNPADYRGRRIVVVGGGNVAVEAAVDLVSTRSGAEISPRSPKEMNDVTLLVRDFLAPTVKFGNKFQLYQCADDGILNLRFGVAIKEMRENELVLQDVETGRDLETIPNDYVFALIGGERPDRFLQSIGITIT